MGEVMAGKHLESLQNNECRWKVALELLDFTRTYLGVRYGWHDKKMLPKGQDPEGIVLGLIEKLLSGEGRPLNDSVGLIFQLKGMIRSEVWNLLHCSDAKKVSFEAAGDDGPNHEPVCDSFADEIVGSMDVCQRLFALLEEHPKVKADEDFGYVVLAYQDGADSAQAVAEKTGIRVERIYEYNRQLKKIYPSLKAKLIQ
jgi:hypothetical protein